MKEITINNLLDNKTNYKSKKSALNRCTTKLQSLEIAINLKTKVPLTVTRPPFLGQLWSYF